jgi:hypothetical protein
VIPLLKNGRKQWMSIINNSPKADTTAIGSGGEPTNSRNGPTGGVKSKLAT